MVSVYIIIIILLQAGFVTMYTSIVDPKQPGFGSPSKHLPRGGMAAPELKRKDLCAVLDVVTFLGVFGDPVKAAASIEAKTRKLLATYNNDNQNRCIDEWISHEIIFALTANPYKFAATKKAPQVAPYNDRWAARRAAAALGEDVSEETSNFYCRLGTFDPTWARKTGKVAAGPLQAGEITVNIKLASSEFNTSAVPAANAIKAGGSSSDYDTASNLHNANAEQLLPDNMRLSYEGFSLPAPELVRMLRSSQFASFVEDLKTQFAPMLDEISPGLAAPAGRSRSFRSGGGEAVVVDVSSEEEDGDRIRRTRRGAARPPPFKFPPPAVGGGTPSGDDDDDDNDDETLEQSQRRVTEAGGEQVAA
jgi:hypothetical protein